MPGLLDVLSEPRLDARGYLIKTFEAAVFAEAGLPTRFEEELHTCSKRGVVRGMHFQTPPSAQEKVVFCEHGAIFDVVVDLRRGSPAFGCALSRLLRASLGNGLYVPAGLAHGFATLSDEAVVSYRITTGYAPECDAGILWSSVDAEWPFSDPLVSERDRGFPALSDFSTPFDYALTA
jgi:dTDP-4-dehydrorhamnose 3,5-epimerase